MNELEGLRVLHYGRVSNDAQDVENSISAQFACLDEFSRGHNQIVLKKYKDEAFTGRIDRREGFQEMISDVPHWDPPVDAIVVWKFSRFARNNIDNAIYKHRLRKHGVRVISINEPVDDSPTGRLMEHIIEGMDAYYSENLSTDVTRGMRNLAMRGFYLGNKPPFGYMIVEVEDGDKTRKKLELDPVTSKIVRRAYDTLLSGNTPRNVVTTYNQEGILTAKGNRWSNNRMHDLLTNEHNAGTIVYGLKSNSGLPPVKTPNSHPAIVTQDEFDKVKELLSARAPKVTHPRHAGSDHILSGLVWCRQCGSKYKYKKGTGRSKTYQYLQCTTRVENGLALCEGPNLSGSDFEQMVMDATLQDILTQDNLKRVLEEMQATSGQAHTEAMERVKAADKRLEDLSKREDRIILVYETEELSLEKYSERMKALKEIRSSLEEARESAIAALGEEATILENQQEILDYTSELNEFLRTSETSRCKSWLGKFVKCIWVEPGKATIQYTIPVPDRPTGRGRTYREVALEEPVHPSTRPGPPISPFASCCFVALLPDYKAKACQSLGGNRLRLARGREVIAFENAILPLEAADVADYVVHVGFLQTGDGRHITEGPVMLAHSYLYRVVETGVGVMAGMVNAVNQRWPQIGAGRFQAVAGGAIGVEQLFSLLGHGGATQFRHRSLPFGPVGAGTIVTLTTSQQQAGHQGQQTDLNVATLSVSYGC